MLQVDDLIEIVLNRKSLEKRHPNPDLTVASFEEGVRIWNHPDVMRFFEEISLKWNPKHDYAFFVPCSATKPYPISNSHRRGYLKALLPILDRIDLFVVSEPMAIVPYCFSDEYPIHSYDYDPYRFFIGKLLDQPLARTALDIFVQRIARWLKKYDEKYSKKILMLPKTWHLKVFRRSMRASGIDEKSYHIVTMRGRAAHSAEFMSRQLREISFLKMPV